MNSDHLDQLVLRYKNRGALVDTNILLLFFVGKYDSSQIGRFKRTKAFTIDDFSIILKIFNFFSRIVTTPNILTEVSNLSGQFGEPMRSEYFGSIEPSIEVLHEEYLPSTLACSDPYFVKCGLTDAAIAALAYKKYLVITDDFKLANLLPARGVDVLNFNHLRTHLLFKASGR